MACRRGCMGVSPSRFLMCGGTRRMARAAPAKEARSAFFLGRHGPWLLSRPIHVFVDGSKSWIAGQARA